MLVDVATGAERTVAGESSFDSLASWLPDGSILFVSDADGWFHVVRLTADGRDRIVLTSGEREHGIHTIEFGRGIGFQPVAVAGRDALRPRRDPRRPRGPGRPGTRRRTAAEARSRSTPEDATDAELGDRWSADQPLGRRLATGRLARGRRVGRGDRRERDATAGPVAAAGAGRRARGRASAPGDDLAAGDRRCGAGPGSRAGDRAHRVHGPRRAPDRRQPVAAFPRDGQARWRARSDHRERPRRPHRPGVPILPATQVPPRPRGVRVPRRRLPRLDRLRARVPACQPRRVGPRGRPRRDRCGTVGDRAAVVGRAAGRLRRLVRRVPGAVGARRGAIDVAGRRRPVRRLGDRRELPPRRPARAAGPPAR